MWSALDVAVGLTLTYALIAVVCTAIQEFIAQLFNSRGKMLAQLLAQQNLGDVHAAIANGLTKNPGFLANKTSGTKGSAHAPHYIPAGEFVGAVYAKVKVASDQAKLVVDGLPDGLKTRLEALNLDPQKSADQIKLAIEQWYGDFMDQVNHWYTRRAQVISLVIGIAVAFALHVDTFRIARTLYADEAIRTEMVKLAKGYDAGTGASLCAEKPKDTKEVQACIENTRMALPIPLGWEGSPFKQSSYGDSWLSVVIELAGMFITAFALSLGSRFWFDRLKDLMSLRTGGQPGASAKALGQK
jgi:hypothetical protein